MNQGNEGGKEKEDIAGTEIISTVVTTRAGEDISKVVLAGANGTAGRKWTWDTRLIGEGIKVTAKEDRREAGAVAEDADEAAGEEEAVAEDVGKWYETHSEEWI